jgi:hypothetical protein
MRDGQIPVVLRRVNFCAMGEQKFDDVGVAVTCEEKGRPAQLVTAFQRRSLIK